MGQLSKTVKRKISIFCRRSPIDLRLRHPNENFWTSSDRGRQRPFLNSTIYQTICATIFLPVSANIEDCVYYDLSHQFAESSTKTVLILMLINIQSMYKNFDSLCEFLDSLTFTLHVICLSETRLKSQPLTNISLTNYSFVHVNSKTNAGGEAVYIHENLTFHLNQKQYSRFNSEALWINVTDQFNTTQLE